MMIDRDTQVVDCRCGGGLGRGGGLAQRGTLSEAGRADVVAIAMSPGQRHITKPVCEITYGMRKENIQVRGAFWTILSCRNVYIFVFWRTYRVLVHCSSRYLDGFFL